MLVICVNISNHFLVAVIKDRVWMTRSSDKRQGVNDYDFLTKIVAFFRFVFSAEKLVSAFCLCLHVKRIHVLQTQPVPDKSNKDSSRKA